MSLRAKILTHSLPLLPTHSFTRQTLSIALSRLPQDHPDYRPEVFSDSVLDTIFGEGSSGPKALEQRWEDDGLEAVQSGSSGGAADSLETKLERRIRYSAEVGEHLVEAYALLTSPGGSSSIPIPSLPSPLKQLLRIPPIYTPPGVRAVHGALSLSDALSGALQQTGGRLPLLRVNPLGPLSYAWRITDAALLREERAQGVKKGVMNEPVGAGPEWYTSRLSLSLAYLQAESQLLQPYPTLPPGEIYASGQPNPHLPAASAVLARNMRWFRQLQATGASLDKGAGEGLGYLEFVGRSAVGLLRSRYW